MAHPETEIDIHPNAQIGHLFTIDHGTGVVIGLCAAVAKLFTDGCMQITEIRKWLSSGRDESHLLN